MKFKDYRIDIKIKSQLEYMGFRKPTDIQYRAIQHVLDGEDIMAVAPTGTGKTAAFAIPMIEKMLQKLSQLVIVTHVTSIDLQRDITFVSI